MAKCYGLNYNFLKSNNDVVVAIIYVLADAQSERIVS
eukprot:SAG31_NODE_2204_length_6198_cov_3.698967_4_plen_37_part_00